MGQSDGEVDVVPRLFFNELCLKEKNNSYDILKNLAASYLVLKKYNISPCRLSENIKNVLYEYLDNIPGCSKSLIAFRYSFFRCPYEIDELTEDDENRYLLNDYAYGVERNPEGLGWAAFFEGVALSLCTSEEWSCSKVRITNNSNYQDVAHLSKKEHLEEWIDQLQVVTLKQSDLSPEQKEFHVRDDHGKNELENYWRKLRCCPYVLECVNSLPFNKNSSKFVRCIKEDYSIDLILNWTNLGFGMNIKTTARNRREAEAIAKILEKDYGHPF